MACLLPMPLRDANLYLNPGALAPEARDLPTVLLVDDTRENLSVIGQKLRPLYQVRVANSGQRSGRRPAMDAFDLAEALALLERHPGAPAPG